MLCTSGLLALVCVYSPEPGISLSLHLGHLFIREENVLHVILILFDEGSRKVAALSSTKLVAAVLNLGTQSNPENCCLAYQSNSSSHHTLERESKNKNLVGDFLELQTLLYYVPSPPNIYKEPQNNYEKFVEL